MSAHIHHVDKLQAPASFVAPRFKLISQVLVVLGVIGLVLAGLDSGERLWATVLQGMLIPTFVS
ncbi:MAG: hypothetical protein ACYTF0_03890, partial [Planctomycetota bacterium]